MLSDAVLVDRVIAGFDDAFDELYRRHVNAAWRLGQAITGNRHDASDAVAEAFARVLQAVRAGRLDNGEAFRSYLLTATRNAALDGIRRQTRTTPADDDDFENVAATGPGPVENVTGAEDAGMVAAAFRSLPERWRSVLWLTAVEGVATKDAADQLGLSPNGTAQLAVRARAGLRDRFLQAHLKTETRPGCRFTVDRLGAYVGGSLAPRELAKVDQHLAGCERCSERKEELQDLGTSLRRVVLPIPLLLGALTAERVHAAFRISTGSTPVPTGFARIKGLAQEPTPFMRRVAAASAAGVLTLGLLSLDIGPADDTPDLELTVPKRPVTHAASDSPFVAFDSSVYDWGQPPRLVAAAAPPAIETRRGDTVLVVAPTPAADAPAEPPAATQLTPASPVPVPEPEPEPECTQPCGDEDEDDGSSSLVVNLGLNLGEHTAGVGLVVGPEPTAGVTIDDTTVGPAPADTPDEPGVVIEIGPVTQTIPLG